MNAVHQARDCICCVHAVACKGCVCQTYKLVIALAYIGMYTGCWTCYKGICTAHRNRMWRHREVLADTGLLACTYQTLGLSF